MTSKDVRNVFKIAFLCFSDLPDNERIQSDSLYIFNGTCYLISVIFVHALLTQV